MAEILKLVNGLDEVDLLDTSSIKVIGWEPSQPAEREIVTFSQYGNGSTLVAQQYENVIEAMTFYVVGTTQDQALLNLRNLRSILRKGVSYFIGLTTTPTYLVVKSNSETNTRYAVLKKFKIEKIPQVIGSSPFSAGAISNGIRFGAGLVTMSMALELSLYRSQPPDSYENALISGTGQDVGYLPSGGQGTVTYGSVNSSMTETPESFSYVTSKFNIANITDVLVWDASSASFIYTWTAGPRTFPFNLFPSPVAVGDILYVGIDEAVSDDPGHFSNIVFDILSARSIALIGNWEYYNGSWVVDQAGSLGGPTTSGHLAIPFVTYRSDEVVVTVATRTGYFRRFVITSIGGDGTTIQQQNRMVYTIDWPYVKIAASQVAGDEIALMRLKITNMGGLSNNGSVMTRIIAGLRSTSRGSLFNAYLNLSDEQVGSSASVSIGANGAFFSSLESATGRVIRLNEAGPNLSYEIANITVGASNPHYSGRFRAFLGVRPVTVVALSDVQFFLKVYHGASQVVPTFTTPRKSLASLNTELHYIDLGEIDTIPSFKSQSVAGLLKLQVNAYVTTASTVDIYCVNLVLIPVDEWSCDLILPTDPMTSVMYAEVNATEPPETGAIIKNVTGDTYAINVVPSMAKAPLLQANAEQKLWFLFFNQNPTSTIRMVAKIEVDPVYQYLTPRGGV